MDLEIRDGKLNLEGLNVDNLDILLQVEEPENCKVLNLSYNNVHEIKNLERFANLEELNLGQNKIEAIKNLDTLSSLKRLFLFTNDISEIKGLENLKKLEELSLDNNKISKIQGLSNLKNLWWLSLAINKITKLENLEELKALQTLNLNENPIREIEGLGYLKNLIDLKLHDNELPDKLTNAFDIEYMNETIKDIEKVKKYCRHEYVEINNKITFAYKPQNLEVGKEGLGLNLGHRGISLIEDIKYLSGISDLTVLLLFNNEIKKIQDLNQFKNLRRLELEKNSISRIENIEELTSLEILRLSENKICKIEGLNGLTSLEILDLNENMISEIENLNNLKNLESLNLSKNKISKINQFPEIFSLKSLNLNENLIKEISFLKKIPNLIKLCLGSNEIDDIQILEKIGNLRELDISNNHIRDIKALIPLSNLRILNISNNNIEQISVLKHLTNLEELRVSDNEKVDSITNRIKDVSNGREFAHNYVIYCILEELVNHIKSSKESNIIFFDKYNDYHRFLLNYKYSEIKPIKELITDEVIDFQVGKNNFITSVFNLDYIVDRINILLEKVNCGEKFRYEYLTDELNIANIDILKNLLKHIEEGNLANKKFLRKYDGIKILDRNGFQVKDNKKTNLTFDEIIEPSLLNDHPLYNPIVDEINRAYRSLIFTAMYVLIRKLLENLLYDCLREFYGSQIEKYYNVNRKQPIGFGLLIHNFNEMTNITDFSIRVGIIEQQYTDILRDFQAKGNIDAHSPFNLPHQDFVEERKSKINNLIRTLSNIIKRLKSN